MQSNPVIAGDRFYYLIYFKTNVTNTAQCDKETDPHSNTVYYQTKFTEDQWVRELHVLRVGSDGSHQDLVLKTATTDHQYHYTYRSPQTGTDANGYPIYTGWQKHEDFAGSWSGSFGVVLDHPLITNADQGVVFSWVDVSGGGNTYTHDWDSSGNTTENRTNQPSSDTTKLSSISGGQLSGEAALQVDPSEQGWYLQIYLQREDGTFIGNYWGTTDQLIAFDATGKVSWKKSISGSFTPKYALADGAIVYEDATFSITHDEVTVDINGNEVNRVADDGIKYSWRGVYQRGSTKSVVAELPPLALSFQSVAGGNLTGNDTALSIRVFQLNWCANNSCTLGYAPRYGGTTVFDSDVDFFYRRSRLIENQPVPTKIELSASEIAIIKSEALKALKQAFYFFPINALSVQGEVGNQASTNFVEVSGGYYVVEPGQAPTCGLTGPGRSGSTVWYECNEGQAQWPLNLQDTDLSGDRSSAAFTNLLRAIGRGIGNTSAHELAHQILDVKCGMNDDPSKVGVYDGGSADSGTDASSYTGLGPNNVPIHWSQNTARCLAERITEGKSLSEVQ